MAPQLESIESLIESIIHGAHFLNPDYKKYLVALLVGVLYRCLIIGAGTILFTDYFREDRTALNVIWGLSLGYLCLELIVYQIKLYKTRQVMKDNEEWTIKALKMTIKNDKGSVNELIAKEALRRIPFHNDL